MNAERIVYLKDKLQSWPGEMALTSEDVADLLAILTEYERIKNDYEKMLKREALDDRIVARMQGQMDDLAAQNETLCHELKKAGG